MVGNNLILCVSLEETIFHQENQMVFFDFYTKRLMEIIIPHKPKKIYITIIKKIFYF